jgi:CHASE2 domain-containing sensor protein
MGTIDPIVHEVLLVGFLALIGVRVTRGLRRREPRRQIIEAQLFPGVFVLVTLSWIFPRWWIPLVVGMVALLFAMLLSLIRSKRR